LAKSQNNYARAKLNWYLFCAVMLPSVIYASFSRTCCQQCHKA